jgi:hypothetical protein
MSDPESGHRVAQDLEVQNGCIIVCTVEGTDEFADRYANKLTRADQIRVEAAIEFLEEIGPGLGRPRADSLDGTKLKELIPRGGHIRILFRFDPRQAGILLIGGTKEDLWDEWYRKTIPVGEILYEEYLADLREEGLLE